MSSVFQEMDKASLATSTIDHAWSYLSQACQHGLRRRMTKTNPAADVQLPEARPAKKRKSFTVERSRVCSSPPSRPIRGRLCGSPG